MSGEFRYEPADANNTIAESFLTSFVQSGDVLPLAVEGDSTSSPFTSLNPALEGVTLHTSVTGEYCKQLSVLVSDVPSRVKCAAYHHSSVCHHLVGYPGHKRDPTKLRCEPLLINYVCELNLIRYTILWGPSL